MNYMFQGFETLQFRAGQEKEEEKEEEEWNKIPDLENFAIWGGTGGREEDVEILMFVLGYDYGELEIAVEVIV